MLRLFFLGLIAATLGACAPTPVIATNDNPAMQALLTGPQGNDNPVMQALLTGPRRNEDVTIKM
jgi:hypothetical protein